ncbi:MAG: tripartite tricarboxylate transporter substrate binding protein [Betaproteobacteria bacterium]|nr:tripartite tricarboxylate transporter substrate binding protein [Betaproteobacteria bacterium]
MRSIGFIFALAAGVACAQGYPAKPIRMISPVPAGSGIDVVARIAADKLAQNMGATIIVDNIAGAATMIGAAAAARAAPDGYTLLFWSEAAPLGALANPKLTFDPVKDLLPVGTLAKGVFFLAVNPSLPVNSVAELVALAKLKPGALAYGSSGIGSPHHVVTEMLIGATGMQVLHVPYKGSGETVTSLMRGDVQFALGLPSSFTPHLKSGKFRGIAVAAPTRSPVFPDLPTITETGVKGVEYLSWYAVFAPTGTPQPILERLHAEMAKIVADKGYIEERLGRIGLEPFAAGSLAETMKLSQQYYDLLAPVVKRAGIKQE